MAQVFDVARQMDWTGLADGEVRKGEVIYDLPDREAPIGAGQAILLDPGEPHGARVLEGAVSINVDFE